MRMNRRAALHSGGGVLYTLSYTGSHTQQEILSGDLPYMLYTFTSSGQLTISARGRLRGDICLVGGGGAGGRGAITGTSTANYVPCAGGGGGGGFMAEHWDIALASGMIVIGDGGMAGPLGSNQSGGATSYLDYVAAGGERAGSYLSAADNNRGGDGGSGGGGGWHDSVITAANCGMGGGITTTPFGDTGNFPNRHCAGGGGGTGSVGLRTGYAGKGGAGGTNGGNGGSTGHIAFISQYALGGDNGGGNGGACATAGANAGAPGAFYGAGGGGGAARNDNSGKTYLANGGNGFQGVLYLRIAL